MKECLFCESESARKNWRLQSWGQRWKCMDCKKQFSTWWARDTYTPEFKRTVIDEYCHSPAKSKQVLEKYGISSRTLIKRKKEHIQTCASCIS
jgi:transposase-like protein